MTDWKNLCSELVAELDRYSVPKGRFKSIEKAKRALKINKNAEKQPVSVAHKLKTDPYLFDLFLTNSQISTILQVIATRVEELGVLYPDLNAIDVADWLQHEAENPD